MKELRTKDLYYRLCVLRRYIFLILRECDLLGEKSLAVQQMANRLRRTK